MLDKNGKASRGCRCQPCAEERRARDIRRTKIKRLAMARGEPHSGFVDIEMARTILKELIENRGWTVKGVAEAAEMDRSTISRIYSGRKGTKRVYQYIYRRLEGLLQLDPREPTNRGRVSTEKFRLAMQCAMAEGYRFQDVAEFINERYGVACTPHGLNFVYNRGKWINRMYRDGAIEFLKSTGGRMGPCDQNRTRAKREGWLPAIAYDEFV